MPAEKNAKQTRRTYTGAFKAQVVLEALEGTRDLNSLAACYDLHPNQIKNWKSVLRKRLPQLFEDRRQWRQPEPLCTPDR